MKKVLILLLAVSFSLIQSNKMKPMMGAYIDKNGDYSNPTIRLVDKVFLNTQLGMAKKELFSDFGLFKKTLQHHLSAQPDLVEQFKDIKNSEDLHAFIEMLPKTDQRIILSVLNTIHQNAERIIEETDTLQQSLMQSGVRPTVLPQKKWYRTGKSSRAMINKQETLVTK